jgi:hypothetical protein
MDRLFRFATTWLTRACLGLAAATAVIGCHHAFMESDSETCKHHGCEEVPKGAIPQPIGTFTDSYLVRQMDKGRADAFVVYYNEWLDGQSVLGPFGADHLARIANGVRLCPYPVVIQPEPDHPALTSERQRVVIEGLLNAGITDAAARVVVGRPMAEGLFGEEAERIYPQMIRGGYPGSGYGALGGYGTLGGYSGFGAFGGVLGAGSFTGYGFQ